MGAETPPCKGKSYNTRYLAIHHPEKNPAYAPPVQALHVIYTFSFNILSFLKSFSSF